MKFRKYVLNGLVFSLALVGGCDDGNMIVDPNQEAEVQPSLLMGPWLGTDPCPSCDGIFVGEPYTFTDCALGASGPSGDQDGDGLADGCEARLAEAFAPEMAISSSEPEPVREPYWAATFDHQNPSAVRVLYAIGWHNDGGAYGSFCNQCTAHIGDSEWLSVIVTYNGSSDHWELDSAEYSAHGGSNSYGYADMEYPSGVDKSYPRAWIAWGKHAGYATESQCDSGGALGYDDCPGNSVRVRVSAGTYQNLGHGQNQLINCVQSNIISSSYYECFWSSSYFTGWSGDNSDQVPGYATPLNSQGFWGQPS